jgi:hypothetical protein
MSVRLRMSAAQRFELIPAAGLIRQRHMAPGLEASRWNVPSGVQSLDEHFRAEQPLWAKHV